VKNLERNLNDRCEISNKKDLRKNALEKRNLLSLEDIKAKSFMISDRLFEMKEYSDSSLIYLYASYKSEVMTDYIIERAYKDGKRLALPVSFIEQQRVIEGNTYIIENDIPRMDFYEINPESILKIGYKGIKEPDKNDINTKAVTEMPDLFIIPGAAFDIIRNRIGYGKGFYDNYINGHEISSKIIALAFECQILNKIIIAEEHDRKPDMIITEERIIK